MPGKILSVLVTVGSAIKRGDAVCTLEAMKMEMPISATAAGTVKAIHVRVGESVPNDAPLVTIG
jgi:biotin carboxyl carrier protein